MKKLILLLSIVLLFSCEQTQKGALKGSWLRKGTINYKEGKPVDTIEFKGVYSFERRYTGQLNIPYGIIDRIAEKGSFHRYYIGQTNERLKKDSLIIQQIEKEIN